MTDPVKVIAPINDAERRSRTAIRYGYGRFLEDAHRHSSMSASSVARHADQPRQQDRRGSCAGSATSSGIWPSFRHLRLPRTPRDRTADNGDRAEQNGDPGVESGWRIAMTRVVRITARRHADDAVDIAAAATCFLIARARRSAHDEKDARRRYREDRCDVPALIIVLPSLASCGTWRSMRWVTRNPPEDINGGNHDTHDIRRSEPSR